MSVIETMYHAKLISGEIKYGAKYQFTHRSGKITKVDTLIGPEVIATLNIEKGWSKKYHYHDYNFSIDGSSREERFNLYLRYSSKMGSGTGGISTFRDNYIVVIDNDSLYLYMHKIACVSPLPLKAGTSDDTKLYFAGKNDFPYQRYLRNDKEILSEMSLSVLDATRL